jgi:hypothetical protein
VGGATIFNVDVLTVLINVEVVELPPGENTVPFNLKIPSDANARLYVPLDSILGCVQLNVPEPLSYRNPGASAGRFAVPVGPCAPSFP